MILWFSSLSSTWKLGKRPVQKWVLIIHPTPLPVSPSPFSSTVSLFSLCAAVLYIFCYCTINSKNVTCKSTHKYINILENFKPTASSPVDVPAKGMGLGPFLIKPRVGLMRREGGRGPYSEVDESLQKPHRFYQEGQH